MLPPSKSLDESRGDQRHLRAARGANRPILCAFGQMRRMRFEPVSSQSLHSSKRSEARLPDPPYDRRGQGTVAAGHLRTSQLASANSHPPTRSLRRCGPCSPPVTFYSCTSLLCSSDTARPPTPSTFIGQSSTSTDVREIAGGIEHSWASEIVEWCFRSSRCDTACPTTCDFSNRSLARGLRPP